jgi:hypothetical protein
MGDIRTEGGDNTPLDASGESDLRGDALEGSNSKKAVDRAARAKARNTDTTLRLDGEKDTLYDDGLEIDDGDAAPLTGQGGRDDTQNRD